MTSTSLEIDCHNEFFSNYLKKKMRKENGEKLFFSLLKNLDSEQICTKVDIVLN